MQKRIMLATVVLIQSSFISATKRPALNIEVPEKKISVYDYNQQAKLAGCEEALSNYTFKINQLGREPLSETNKTLVGVIIADAKMMQEIVTPTSPEMGIRFASLIALAKNLYH